MTRLAKLQERLVARQLDALLVTNLYNLRYIANFTGTTGVALVTPKKAFFITDARYTQQATKQCVGFEIIENVGPIFNEVKKLASDLGLKTIGFEDNTMPYHHYAQLKQFVQADLVAASGIIEALRAFKDASEFETIRQACAIADKGFDYILGEIKPGMTEVEVANKMDFYMRSLGATSVSFDMIVASGERSAMPHGVATNKVIEKGDFITLDYGCYYNGYVSDMTRTISLGEPRHAQLKEIHAVVLGAQKLVNEKIAVGMRCFDIDKIARDYIVDHGYGDYFIHSTGHGIGLEVHEAPALSRSSEDVLEVGHAVTNEPGIYIDGLGGVRIEDDILVTPAGIEIVTKANKELIIL